MHQHETNPIKSPDKTTYTIELQVHYIDSDMTLYISSMVYKECIKLVGNNNYISKVKIDDVSQPAYYIDRDKLNEYVDTVRKTVKNKAHAALNLTYGDEKITNDLFIRNLAELRIHNDTATYKVRLIDEGAQ